MNKESDTPKPAIMVYEDTTQFQSWYNTLNEKMQAYLKKHYPALFEADPNYDKMSFSVGTRYINVRKGTSVYAFIDRLNGDVLKPASYRAPAKHARGNIFHNDNGLDCTGPHGIEYLRGSHTAFDV